MNLCSADDCSRRVQALGLCDKHYGKKRRGELKTGTGTPPGRRSYVKKGITCYPHTAGVTPGMAPFFVAGCPSCEDKRAKGLVTGSEPPPPGLREHLAGRSVKARRAANLKIKAREPNATL